MKIDLTKLPKDAEEMLMQNLEVTRRLHSGEIRNADAAEHFNGVGKSIKLISTMLANIALRKEKPNLSFLPNGTTFEAALFPAQNKDE